MATLTPLAIACLLHALGAAVLLRLSHHPVRIAALPDIVAPHETPHVPSRLVFLAPAAPGGGGGGGGGNRQSAPIRRAQGIGTDALTLRTRANAESPAVVAATGLEVPAVVLDARALASGTVEQIGLPEGGVSVGTSTGPGLGGGVGSGNGTGIGSGDGPGFGPGSGGGTGGGAYRPGGAVSRPRLVSQVTPRYTPEALRKKIEGSVWLEITITPDGRVGDIRLLHSLDAGLDEEAIAAVRQWRFEPGRLGGEAVSVAVTVALDFNVR